MVAQSTHGPLTQGEIERGLTALGVERGAVLLVHSSLSALGWVVGGSVTVVRALEAVVGPEGSLLMPSYSESAPEPSLWEDPPVPRDWWETIRTNGPPYDPAWTPTRGLGAIAEAFRTQPGTQRSSHPNNSFAARGPKAGFLVGGHELDGSLGEGSPLARLYELEGRVLLLGVRHHSNSSLHLAEYRAQWPGRSHMVHFEARVLQSGAVTSEHFVDIDLDSDDFDRLGEEYEQSGGFVALGRIGLAECRLFAQRPIVDYAVRWIERNRLSR